MQIFDLNVSNQNTLVNYICVIYCYKKFYSKPLEIVQYILQILDLDVSAKQ